MHRVDIDQILSEGEARRRSEKERAKVIAAVRRDATRSIPTALRYFAMAVLQGAMVYRYAQRQQEFSTSIVLEGICLCGMLCVWLGMGVRSLWISPRDTALLLLIEEAIEGKQPNKSPQHNAGIGPAALDSASPLRPALSSEETARPQSPRG